MALKEFEEISGVKNFKRDTHKILMHTLEDFYGATVRLVFNPIFTFRKRYNVNIEASPKREFYMVEGHEDSVFLITYVEKDDSIFYLGIQLDSPIVRYIDTSVFHFTCVNIGLRLTQASGNAFRSCHNLFNESLAKEIVVGAIGRGKYDLSKISYVIDLFMGCVLQHLKERIFLQV